MTNVLAARPAPLSRVWSGGTVIAEDVEGDDLSDVLQLHSDASAWWVLSRSDEDAGRELRRAAEPLDLDELAIRELLTDDHRAKYEELGQSRLIMTNAVALDRETVELTAHPVSLVVTDRALICLVDPDRDGFHPARLLGQAGDQLAAGGVEHALQLVLAAVVRTYGDVVEWLETRSDDLAASLFEQRPLSRDEQLDAFRLRTVLGQLRRMTDPMRAVLDDLVDGQDDADARRGERTPPDQRSQEQMLARRWTMIQQQHHRVANAADALRESLSSVFDTSLALADLRMNAIMKKLTAWAAIIAVPTLVTGFAGMNVAFPLDGTSEGFWLCLSIMVVSVVALYLMFRRQDWI